MSRLRRLRMDFNKRSLTPLEADIVLGMVEKNLATIDTATARRWSGRGTKSVSKLLASLRDKGWLERLGRGKFALVPPERGPEALGRSEEHTSELQSLMRISYAVF